MPSHYKMKENKKPEGHGSPELPKKVLKNVVKTFKIATATNATKSKYNQ